MNEQQIRQLIRQEIQADKSNSRFGLNVIPVHAHTGQNDGSQINSSNLVPGLKTLGTITMATVGATYTLNTGFNPSSVVFSGTPYHSSGGGKDKHTFVYGYAALGQNLPFQPAGTRGVVAGGSYEIIQGSTSFYAGGSGSTTAFAATNDENHIVNVNDGSSDVVRATVTGYSPSGITIKLDTLSTGWTLIGNFYVS
ncbi:MAG: hypothetical protein KGL39_34640 [Patescibacteria group bacterium]|nr:hypothetical protein [Patescibacteria group bacterium]